MMTTPHTNAQELVNPDNLVVKQPSPPETRRPKDAVTKLLRAELSILEAMENLELSIAKRETELERLQSQLDVVERDLEKTNQKFDSLTASLDSARGLVKRRLKAMIQLRRTEPYEVLFASESHGDFLRKKRAMTGLLASDNARIAAYRKQLDAWEISRKDLMRRKTNLANTRTGIANVIQDLTWDKEEKRLLLEAVEEQKSYAAKVEIEMNSVDQGLRDKIDALKDESRNRLWFERSKGRLPIPIYKGEIIGRFGKRQHRRFGTRTNHRGIDIVPKAWGGRREVKVKSIYWGYVAYTGWIRGLGKTVIIDHTRGYMTLYAHLDRIGVELNQKIKTGQRIGTMGDTGSLEGSRLYMELRKIGRAINPDPWFR